MPHSKSEMPPQSPHQATVAETLAADVWRIVVHSEADSRRTASIYVVGLGNTLVLVDAGWPEHTSGRELAEGLGSIGVRFADVTGIVLTHMHRDHCGIAGTIQAASDCWVAAHPLEVSAYRRRFDDVDNYRRDIEVWLTSAGAPPLAAAEMAASVPSWPEGIPECIPSGVLEDGRPVPGAEALIALHTPGHTDGHVCYHQPSRGVVYSGDHLLADITPNVCFFGQGNRSPLEDYLASLDRIEREGQTLTALPGHRGVVQDIGGRVRQVKRHHEERLDEVHRLTPESASVWEVAGKMSWRHDFSSMSVVTQRIALGEAHAHLLLAEASTGTMA